MNEQLENLMEASYVGDINAMRRILDNNDIDVNTTDINGSNILMSYLQARTNPIDFTTIDEEINFINYLLHVRNININARDTEGNTALMIALQYYDGDLGSNQIIDTLSRHTLLNIDTENNERINALMIASSLGNIEVVNMLLRLNPNLNSIDDYGNTALTYAFVNGRGDIVDRLIEVGADVNLGNYRILRNEEMIDNTITPYFSSLLLNNENNINNINNQIDINNDLVSEISQYLLYDIDGNKPRSIKKKKSRSIKKKKSRSSKKNKSRSSKKRSRSIIKK